MEVFVCLVGLFVVAAIFNERRGKGRNKSGEDYWDWD